MTEFINSIILVILSAIVLVNTIQGHYFLLKLAALESELKRSLPDLGRG